MKNNIINNYGFFKDNISKSDNFYLNQLKQVKKLDSNVIQSMSSSF